MNSHVSGGAVRLKNISGVSVKSLIEYSTAGDRGLRLGDDAVIKFSPLDPNWHNVGKVLRLNDYNGTFETQSKVYINYELVRQRAVENLFLAKALETTNCRVKVRK